MEAMLREGSKPVPELKARSTLQLGSAFGSGKFFICPTPRHVLTLAERGQKDFTSAAAEAAFPSGRLLLEELGVLRGSRQVGYRDPPAPTGIQPQPSPANPNSSFQTGACSSCKHAWRGGRRCLI